MFQAKQAPHIRFAGFLKVFSVLWLILGILLLISIIKGSFVNGITIAWCIASVGFFFFYRKTAQVLKTYTAEEASQFRYLRYLNPIAPIIYVTTVLLLIMVVLNVIMLIWLTLGFLLFFIGILVTFGLLLMDKTYKLSNFIDTPESFFKAEFYFLEHVISPELIILLLALLYFIIPISVSVMILLQHRKNGEIKK
jgi:hypothetical protein